MVRKKKLLLLVLISSLTSLVISVSYLLSFLAESSHQTPHRTYRPFKLSPLLSNIHKAIYKQLKQPVRKLNHQRLSINTNFTKSYDELWMEANSWASKGRVVDFNSLHLGEVLGAMKTAKIIKADVLRQGTQLKLGLTLEGGQEVIFKPVWSPLNRSTPDDAPPVFGSDRPNAEVVGFYMSFLLNEAKATPAVIRPISLRDEIVPVATPDLLETIFKRNDTVCVYGKCTRCSIARSLCAKQNGLVEGVVIFKLMDKTLLRQQSPWRRRYHDEPFKQWEKSRNYCAHSVISKLDMHVVLDLIDQAIFDFLIQNGDRHHSETDRFGTMIWLDNGKGFGNPRVDHLDILAPLYQCCVIRKRMLQALEGLRGEGYLKKLLEDMPEIEKLVMKEHLDGIERRLSLVFATVKYCESKSDEHKVL